MDGPFIICPCCGEQFLPAEVYLPDSFLGKPTEIIRNTSGKIDFFFGNNMDLDEEYVCDNCSNKFKIHANVSFETTSVKEKDRPAKHITKFNKKDKYNLEETLF